MSEKPIFIRLQEMIEDQILSGSYKKGELVISSTQICKLYNVNPATAIKALSSLTTDGVLEKDRGIGMRVTKDAFDIILKRRKNDFLFIHLTDFVSEAKKLGITAIELTHLIEKNY